MSKLQWIHTPDGVTAVKVEKDKEPETEEIEAGIQYLFDFGENDAVCIDKKTKPGDR